ncbi:MAG: hypothetical protein ACFFFT_00105 [Candidatus Thorarchaeota archaeon]
MKLTLFPCVIVVVLANKLAFGNAPRYVKAIIVNILFPQDNQLQFQPNLGTYL